MMTLKTRILESLKWLVPVILATQKAEIISRIVVRDQSEQIVLRPYLENTQHKKRLAEWLTW
jgi:hypothetical protein